MGSGLWCQLREVDRAGVGQASAYFLGFLLHRYSALCIGVKLDDLKIEGSPTSLLYKVLKNDAIKIPKNMPKVTFCGYYRPPEAGTTVPSP